MNHEIFRNYYIGKYGEDLLITPKKYSRDYFIFKSSVLNENHPVEISKEDKEIILKLYCEYGFVESIDRTNLKTLKIRANSLSSAFTFAVFQYLEKKDESLLKDARTILEDLDVLELSEEQYANWFINDVQKSLLKDIKELRNKLINEHICTTKELTK